MDYKRVNNDVNGNPRYVFHYSEFLSADDLKRIDSEVSKRPKEWYDRNLIFAPRQTKGYELAVKKAKQIGGRKYNGKDFGGGIVFQSYNIQETIKRIKSL